ncbi:MAG TPA: M23 family metallopeptidase [Candidatus Onthousia faecigallinarum]|nr:M23 family metallopeptidase [Candidatus Onthousia faecigallinarum]
MNFKNVLIISIAAIVSFVILFFTPNTKALEPQNVYRVYLAGKSIGLVEDATALDQYIDNEQQMLREQYQVDKVYAPEDLKIVKDVTYNENISTTQEIYEKIKDIEPFTIKGYEVTISGIDTTNEQGEVVEGVDQTIYVLDEQVFEDAMDTTIRAFVGSDRYDKYINNQQAEIASGSTGSLIENIYLENKVTIKEKNIPSDEKIYENSADLSKYLLYGTLEEQQKYTVQKGDTISDVSFNNKLSNEEFLIANPEFTDANSLLYEGQSVNISIIKPQFRLIEVERQVALQDIPYETETRYDNSQYTTYEETIQEGVNGSQLVTSVLEKVNGQVENATIDTSATQVVSEPTKRIIVKGTKQRYSGGGTDSSLSGNSKVEGYWLWPTRTPYYISSPYAYRWGTLHDGMDIAGAGYGSPIYASNNGIVVASTYKYDNGQYIVINHNNGYYTMYAHLAERYVSVGQEVSIGDTIGTMGQTGAATGVHLHFSLWRGYPYSRGSSSMNPMSLF